MAKPASIVALRGTLAAIPPRGYDDATYYWRVAMIDGDGRLGEYSDAMQFTKQYPVTTLVEPASGSVSSLAPTFVWTPVNGAASYKLEVSLSPTFAPTYDSVTTNSTRFTPTKKYAQQAYYWRVAIVDKDLKAGPFNDATVLINPYSYHVFLPVTLSNH